jgi:WbqC-like protein family
MPASKRIAIVQSNYIPWKGYFDLINMVDEFILYDDMQYTRRDWRNRNYIKTPRGREWLTVAVDVKGKYFQKIRETRISDPGWAQTHWTTLVHNYGKARHFAEYRAIFEELYLGCNEELLSRVNFRLIEAICRLLGIRTRISWSMDYELVEGKTERLVDLCKAAGARHYLSGPSAKGYLEEHLFEQDGISVSYMDYSGYPPYSQLHGAFEHGVTILDLLFNEGPDAPRYMKSF